VVRRVKVENSVFIYRLICGRLHHLLGPVTHVAVGGAKVVSLLSLGGRWPKHRELVSKTYHDMRVCRLLFMQSVAKHVGCN
jgi:hypothetical protein